MDARLSPLSSRPARALGAALLIVAVAACAAAPAATALPTPVPATPYLSAAPTPTPAPPFPATLTDDDGTTVAIPAEPQRIVSLMPAVTETLFALGAGSRIVGKAQDVLLYPPQASAVPDFERFDNNAVSVDVEKIVAAKADLVIAGGNGGTPADAITKLRSLGIPVLVVYASTVEKVFTDIELIGRAVGPADAATAMATAMRADFAAVAASVKEAARPRVFYEISAWQGTYYGPADQSFLAEMVTLSGGNPITTGSASAYTIPAEILIKADPQLILLADAAYGTTVAEVGTRPGWSTMTAVKDGAVEPIDDTTISRPGPRLVLGLALLAGTIHPELAIPAPSPIPPVPAVP